MRNRSFTLVEMLIVVVVIGILATLGINMYYGSVENSRAQVCATNLKTLKTALDIYVMENDSMPGSLSQIPQDMINRAYARVMTGQTRFLTRLAETVLRFDARGSAFAQTVSGFDFMKNVLAKGDLKVMTCPADKTPPSEGGSSYGLHSFWLTKTAAQYRNQSFGRFVPVIIDCDSAVFNGNIASRHRNRAQVIWRSGEVQMTSVVSTYGS